MSGIIMKAIYIVGVGWQCDNLPEEGTKLYLGYEVDHLKQTLIAIKSNLNCFQEVQAQLGEDIFDVLESC
jgi:hypothetical protein